MGWKPDIRQVVAAFLAVVITGLVRGALGVASSLSLSGWAGAWIGAVLLVALYLVFIRLLRRAQAHS